MHSDSISQPLPWESLHRPQLELQRWEEVYVHAVLERMFPTCYIQVDKHCLCHHKSRTSPNLTPRDVLWRNSLYQGPWLVLTFSDKCILCSIIFVSCSIFCCPQIHALYTVILTLSFPTTQASAASCRLLLPYCMHAAFQKAVFSQ